MKGERIHILEELPCPAAHATASATPRAFIIRGGREMENHFECLWDLFRSIPRSRPRRERAGRVLLAEQGRPQLLAHAGDRAPREDAHTDKKFSMSDKACMELMQLFFTKDEDLYDKKISDVLGEEFFKSNFWLYWRSMFAFEDWHSALEMKLYVQRFIHHIGGLPDLRP